jgi:UDPglucose 6-dehydrogenase
VLAEVSSVTDRPVDVASNPEFLKEGAAVEDFLRPDRVVIGIRTRRAAELLHEIYEPFVRTGAPIIETDPCSAEMAKYASNGMLAARITFMNEVARLCDRLGADVESVRRIVGSDRRIGPAYLFAGPGYGGSCFPKDIRAMAAESKELGARLPVIAAVEESNCVQREHLFDVLRENLGRELAGSRVAVWGLAFKPRTDDVRESPALELVRRLVASGAEPAVFDPEAMETARRALADVGGSVMWARDRYDAAKDADGLVLVTEWQEFRRPDPGRLASAMRGRAVFDWRNILDRKALTGAGFTVLGVGRPAAGPS